MCHKLLLRSTHCLSLTIFLVSIAFCSIIHAADTPFEFESPAQQAQYQKLLEELRCLVCQNQSLADSHADLAQDLRDEVYRMLGEGKSNDEVREFMVARYGDFVLYKPPIKSSTALLWFGPFILIFLAGFVVWRTVARQKNAPQDLTEQEREFAEQLQAQSNASHDDFPSNRLSADESRRDASPIKPSEES